MTTIDTPEFRKLLTEFTRRASYNISGKASPSALIAHIDAWGAQLARKSQEYVDSEVGTPD